MSKAENIKSNRGKIREVNILVPKQKPESRTKYVTKKPVQPKVPGRSQPKKTKTPKPNSEHNIIPVPPSENRPQTVKKSMEVPQKNRSMKSPGKRATERSPQPKSNKGAPARKRARTSKQKPTTRNPKKTEKKPSKKALKPKATISLRLEEPGLHIADRHPSRKVIELLLLQVIAKITNTPIKPKRGRIIITEDQINKIVQNDADRTLILRYISTKIDQYLSGDLKILAWDYLNQFGIPDKIELKYPQLPGFLNNLAFTFKLKITLDVLLLYYPPETIQKILMELPDVTQLSIQDIEQYEHYFWDVKDDLDLPRVKLALANLLRTIRYEITSGENYVKHRESIGDPVSSKELANIHSLLEGINGTDQPNPLSPEQNFQLVLTPYLKSDKPELYCPWRKVCSVTDHSKPMESYKLQISVLEGNLSIDDIFLKIGFIPKKYRDVERCAQDLIQYLMMETSKHLVGQNLENTSNFFKKKALPFANFLRLLGVSAINQQLPSFSEEIERVERDPTDFEDIFEKQQQIFTKKT